VNAGRIVECEGLRDKSTHRPSEHARSLEVERLDHTRHVVGEFGYIKWRSIVVRGANASVVEEDEVVGGREPINERWVPVGARSREPVEED